jgi:metallo-beta-lactamase family protein
MKITFHGAAQNVTGSKHLIETDGYQLLLDCGFHQGHRKEAEKLNRNFPLDAKVVDAVILSHAHLDHCGLLPLLIKQGFKGNIYATPATVDVAEQMLEDSAHIQESDAGYLNRHIKKGDSPLEPLYTKDDIKPTMNRFKSVPYVKHGQDWTVLNPNVKFKLYDAGHILGSSIIVVEITEQGQGASGPPTKKTIAYTGDLGRKQAPILCDPQYIEEQVDILLSEATYGNRLHEPYQETESVIKEHIEYAVKHQGKIIVPAFALGRTQELIYMLHKLFHTQGFPKIPVYLDSPLATRVTQVFKKHRNVFDEESWKDFDPEKDLPLMFESLIYTPDTQDSIKLNTAKGPMMIISASGMMEAGRVLHHLKNNIEDKHTTILITGFQAQNTLGRRIQDGVKDIRIFNQHYKVNAQVETVPALSAHADQIELLDYIGNCKGLSKLFLVHGEKEGMEVLKAKVKEAHPDITVEIPERGEGFFT